LVNLFEFYDDARTCQHQNFQGLLVSKLYYVYSAFIGRYHVSHPCKGLENLLYAFISAFWDLHA